MKSHWITRTMITAAVLGILAVSGTVAAQDAGTTARQWWNNPSVQQKLELSGEQVSEITQLNIDLGVRADEASDARRNAGSTLKDAAAGDPSGDQFTTATEAYRKASDDLALLSVERLQRLTTILSPDQFAALGETAPGALAPKVGTGAAGGLRSLASATSGK